LGRAGEHHRGSAEVFSQASHQGQALFTDPLSARLTGSVGDDTDTAAGDARNVVGSRQLRVKPFDGAGLLHVERLAGGHRGCGIDQRHPPYALAACERVRDGTAELARTDDADSCHNREGVGLVPRSGPAAVL
jgi:hypothetical protein